MQDNSENIKFETIKKLVQTKFTPKNLENLSHLDSTSPPSVFIGSKLKYPNVNIGILSPLERDKNAWLYDSEKYWANKNFEINEVVKLRKGLLNSRFRGVVKDARASNLSSKNNRFIEIAKQIALGNKPVDLEIDLKNKLNSEYKKDRILKPTGFKGSLKQAKIIGNVKIERQIEKVIDDNIKSSEALKQLYEKNIDEYKLNKILSVGVLGLKKNKKFVPTRWSITATDDTLGKNLIEQIKNYKCIENHEFFFGEFLGNCYLIMLFPDVWSYELFELYLPGSSWNPSKELKASTNYEFYEGRKTYAEETAGGYYASRLPILEYLNKNKRQASVLVIRIETPSYWASLGVWVVRESVRKALHNPARKNKPMQFDSRKEIIEACKKISMIKYGYNPEKIIKKSVLLNTIKTQKKLGEWF
ncbi:MAG: hypothetical protein ACOCUU_00395 [Nanoarchaeota archaeon]